MLLLIASCLGLCAAGYMILLQKKERAARRAFYARQCQAKLEVSMPKQETVTTELTCGYYIIGRRRRRSDLCLNDQTVSRQHAVLWYNGTQYCIRPIKKKDGISMVYVNHRQVSLEGQAVHDGDVIQVGDTRMKLYRKK